MDNSSLLTDPTSRHETARGNDVKTPLPTWKPAMLHIPALAAIFACTLACIALLELAAQTLPRSFTEIAYTTVPGTSLAVAATSSQLLSKRQSLSTLAEQTYPTLDFTQIVAVSTLTPSTTPPYPTPLSSVVVPQSTPAASSTPSRLTTLTTSKTPSSSITSSSAGALQSTPVASSTLSGLTTLTVSKTPSSSITSSSVEVPQSTPVALSTLLVLTTLTTSKTTSSSVPSSSAGVPQSRPVALSTLQKSTSSYIVPVPATALTYSVQSDSKSTTPVSLQAYQSFSSSHTTSSDTCSTSTTRSVSSTELAYTTISTSTFAASSLSEISTTTSASVQAATSAASDGDQVAAEVFKISVTHYPVWASVVAAYVPVITATLYKFLWDALYNSVHLVAPFMSMLRQQGAGHKTLSLNYLSPTLLSNPFTAWPVALITLAYIATLTLSSLAAESLFTDTIYCPEGSIPGTLNPCPARLSDKIHTIRILQGVLALLGSVCVILIWMFRHKRKTGLYQNPSSISGLASLAQHGELLKFFQELPQQCARMDSELHSKRFGLGLYAKPPASFDYGILPIKQIHDGLPDPDAAELDDDPPLTLSRRLSVTKEIHTRQSP